MNASSLITHRRWGTSISFSERGIAVRPLLLPRYDVPWSNVEFVSPTPSYERLDGTWRPKARPSWLPPKLDATTWLVKRGMLSLAIVVRDRSALRPLTPVKPMYDADDKPKAKEGLVELDLRTFALDRPVADLFDLITTHTRLALVVFG